MKFTLTLFFLLSMTAQAKTFTVFDCKATEGGRPVTVKFAVENLFTKHATLGVLKGGDENEPIVVKPNSSLLQQLNENLSFYDIKNGQLHINGDSDGFYSVDFVLYEDSGFHKGYVKVQGDEKMYSKVSCVLKTSH